jgi:crossover junction endodeoxyribonuclease RuvC
VKIFGIDPGSDRTGYGCIERVGSRQSLVICGSLAGPSRATFPDKLKAIHSGLLVLFDRHRPDCVAVESIFHARNVRSALKLGHARGVVLLAASEAGLPVAEYAPAEIKRAVVGYGRAEKHQVQRMIKLLLGLDRAPSPHDVADALAVAICHLQSSTGAIAESVRAEPPRAALRSWRDYRPAGQGPARAEQRPRPASSGERPRPARGAGGKGGEGAPPSARERGWGPASSKK